MLGCSESRQLDDCDDRADQCATVGATRCSEDYSGIDVCAVDAIGCLVWEESTLCGERAACESTGDGGVCVCDDECDDGERRCASRSIEECRADSDGCLYWDEIEDCADSGQGCSDESGAPECVSGCGLECSPEGGERCNGTRIEDCSEDDDGCWNWQERVDCRDSDETCDDSSGSAECVEETCDDECDVLDETQCNATVIEVCQLDDEGCMVWGELVDCADTDEFCSEASGDAECTDSCEDSCDEEGDSRCEGNVIESCEVGAGGCLEWISGEDCEDSGLFCDASSGDALCTDSCEDSCPSNGMSRCLGNVVQLCEMGGGGCLAWTEQVDCADRGLTCGVNADGEAFCFCVDLCDPGESQCDGDTVQECRSVDGCWVWEDVADCSSLGLPCDESSGTAECLSGSGDSCDDALTIWSFPHTVSGSDFAADFGDDQVFTDDSCEARTDEPEAVFAVEAPAGAILIATELDEIDVAISFQSACDPDGACVVSIDDLPSGGVRYEVPTDGTYYVIVERSYGGGDAYEVVINMIEPEDCGDGIDNDRDGDTDCDDSDCFGDSTYCTSEENCSDGEDNDDDGDTDCDDSDCATTPACNDYQGIYELFEPDQRPDLAGHSIIFTPDDAVDMGYSWTASGITDFAVAPGTGTVTATLPLTDDDVAEYSFARLPAFDFYGVAYDSVFVSSNGLLSFGAGNTDWNPNVDDFFDQPTIAALWSDLNPEAGGSIIVDDFFDRLAVTFEGVPRFSASDPHDFQIVLNADGSIELHYLTIGAPTDSRNTFVGLSSGVGVEPYPSETDFVTPAAEVCDDGVDNDTDGDVDCDDSDCFGVSPCDVEETNCTDGLDNDGDGDADCDDSDCYTPELCDPFLGYWEQFNRFVDPADLEGMTLTFTPDASSDQGYVFAVAPPVGAGFPVEPGTGLTSTPLSLDDDDFVELSLSEMTAFPFYGTDYAEIFVGSNGYITFGEGDTENSTEPADHFSLPRVSAYRRDLDPSSRGTVTVDEFDDMAVVTFQDVPRWSRTPDPSLGPQDFQIILNADGVIEIFYLTLSEPDGLVGISNGVGNGTFPTETNFMP